MNHPSNERTLRTSRGGSHRCRSQFGCSTSSGCRWTEEVRWPSSWPCGEPLRWCAPECCVSGYGRRRARRSTAADTNRPRSSSVGPGLTPSTTKEHPSYTTTQDLTGLREHRRHPTTSLTSPVHPQQSRPGEPQPGSASRPTAVPAHHHRLTSRPDAAVGTVMKDRG